MADLFALLHSIEPIGSHFRNLLPDCMTPVEGPFEKNTVVLKTGEISTTALWMPVGYARVLHSISYDALQVMKLKTVETNELIAKILASDYTKVAEQAEFLKMPSDERYDSFLDHFGAKIEQYFELKAIASYLAMDPTTLNILRR